jgi:hypothetical protein
MQVPRLVAAMLVFTAMTAATAFAQAPVSAQDISRLEAAANEVESLTKQLAKTDLRLAGSITESLTDVRDEIAYLRVKLRREGQVSREDYAALRDRIETLRVRAQGQKVSAQPELVTDDPLMAATVPVGTELEVRLSTPLNSGKATVEQRFEATLIEDFVVNRRVVIPAGALTRGFVSSVKAAGRIDRRGSLTLSFDELRIDNRSSRLRASVIQALEAKASNDVARAGAGAVVGGIVGGLLGGGKGALLGVLIGGGGTLAATDGSDVNLPAGTILRIRIDQPLEVVVR